MKRQDSESPDSESLSIITEIYSEWRVEKNVMIYFGSFRFILSHYGSLWFIMGQYGTLWVISLFSIAAFGVHLIFSVLEILVLL